MAHLSDNLPGGAPRLVRLCDYVAYYASANPEAEALIFGEQTWTYASLDASVDACAQALLQLGVRRGDRVATLTTPRAEFIIALMASLRIGAIWVGVNPRYTLREIEHICSDSAPRVFLSLLQDEARDYRSDLMALKSRPASSPLTIVTFPSSDACIGPALNDLTTAAAYIAPSHFEANAHDPAVIVYTSGTTGAPKGAVLSHGALIYSYEAVSRSFAGKEHLRAGMRTLCNLPANHIGCISEIVGNTIIPGGTLILAERFDLEDTFRLVAAERITLIGGVPAMLQPIVDHPLFASDAIASLKMIGWGGAPAPRHMVEKMRATGAHLFTNYGLTEGGAIVAATAPNADDDALSTSVGAPVDLMQTRIVDDKGAPVARGEAGEIQLQGPGVFLGYWNNEAATTSAFTDDGWLRTGDLALERPDGNWSLKGRRGDMFKSGGYNVYPREIELVLESHPGVALAAVVEAPDERYFQVGYAFVARNAGAACDEQSLLAHLRDRLANFKVPKRVITLDVLPMLPIGKVDRHALRHRAVELAQTRA